MKSLPALKGVIGGPLASFMMIACILATLFGGYRLLMYSGPMLSEDFYDASEAGVGHRPLALYDLAIKFYNEEDFDRAKLALEESYKDLTSATGIVPASEQRLAGDIQHLLGVVNEKQKQFRLAISAYEEALRHDSTRLPTKYNLERLKQQFPDIGKGGQTDPKDPGKGTSNNKKGI